MSKKGNEDSEYCCGFLDIRLSLYVIPVYTIIHGLYGVSIVITSYYANYDRVVNLLATFMSCLFMCLGVCLFIVPLYINVIAAKVLGIMTTIFSLIYFIIAIWYYSQYFGFLANSLLDRLFFWKFGYCWAGTEFYFTFWHILTFYMVIFTPLWIYFGYVIYSFGIRLEDVAKNTKDPDEIYYVYRHGSTSGQPIGYLQTTPTYGRGFVQPLNFKPNNPPSRSKTF